MNIVKSGAYMVQKTVRLEGFPGVEGFPEESWLYRNVAEHFKIIWQNILSGYISIRYKLIL